MHARFLLLSAAALIAGCGGEQQVPETPAPAPPKPWNADALAGPFATVGDFCKTMAGATCEERGDAVVAIGESGKPLPTKDGGSLQTVGVTSNDGKAQRVHLLLKRNGELFALPAAQEFDPKDGKRRAVTLRSFTESSGLFIVAFGAETTSGEGDAQRQEMSARQAFCRVVKELPVACALFETERSVATGTSLATVAEETAEVIVSLGESGLVTLTASKQSGAKALEGLSAPGEYRIAFP